MKHLVSEISARGAVSVRIWQLADTINVFEKKLKRTENCWTTPHYVLDAPGTHREPRKTEDEMEGRFREFGKTLASYCAKRGPVELSHSLVVHPVLRKILDTPLDEVERSAVPLLVASSSRKIFSQPLLNTTSQISPHTVIEITNNIYMGKVEKRSGEET
ncbi:unnamed protein product [Porites lobata]|uniref:Uncharacterized protein n=1 Tax=Porites lobata TaxID=104759 RepID=A0ABN8QQ01_9CNID|nr:unnamed protein product [Porites lobata]